MTLKEKSSLMGYFGGKTGALLKGVLLHVSTVRNLTLIMGQNIIADLTSDIQDGCSKCGNIEKLVVPKNGPGKFKVCFCPLNRFQTSVLQVATSYQFFSIYLFH